MIIDHNTAKKIAELYTAASNSRRFTCLGAARTPHKLFTPVSTIWRLRHATKTTRRVISGMGYR